MKQLINLSVYPSDLARFGDSWQAVAAYAREHHLDGLELLIGYEPLPPTLPPDLVQGIHLPFWITWLNVWREGKAAIDRYFPHVPPEYIAYYCGGLNREAMIASLHQAVSHAVPFAPGYAVFHVSHVEVEHAFTRRFPYSDLEVIDATAELLNAVAARFEGGEPPVRLFLENLWWPGLTFTEAAQTERLAERLTFDNWAFVLDTGHLMNTNPALTEEEQAIDYVLDVVSRLPEATRQRIEGLHFCLSTSGAYQTEAIKRGLPPTFAQMSQDERLIAGRDNALAIDQHRPFTSPRCREIVAAIEPRYLTHEFLSDDQAEYARKLQTQQAALGTDRAP